MGRLRHREITQRGTCKLFSFLTPRKAKEIFAAKWEKRAGRVVPDPEDLALGLSGSTKLVDKYGWEFASEIYKTYLHCAASIIRAEGGAITSYDGDRVMGVWVGDVQCTPAARCALKINYAVHNIINPALKAQYTTTDYVVKQVVGIDTSLLRATRTGVRGGNDIVWVGRAANYAAKLTEIGPSCATWITKDVFDRLHDDAKFGGGNREAMWKPYTWNAHGNHSIYGSSWTWKV